MSANDRQEGGAHYSVKGKDLQHWDLARIFQWDPFQYQITKYIMRWRDKHATFEKRLEDLKKARHFLDKYIEDAESWDKKPSTPVSGVKTSARASTIFPTVVLVDEVAPTSGQWMVDGKPVVATTVPEDTNWQIEGYRGDGILHVKCRHCGTLYNTATLQDASRQHGACARGQGYTAQG